MKKLRDWQIYKKKIIQLFLDFTNKTKKNIFKIGVSKFNSQSWFLIFFGFFVSFTNYIVG